MTTRMVSALEYEALLNVDRMVRMAMTNPNCGEFLAVAIQALDQVRKNEGIEPPPAAQPPAKRKIANPHEVHEASDLTKALLNRISKP